MAKKGFFKDMEFDLSLNGPVHFTKTRRTLNEPKEKSSVHLQACEEATCLYEDAWRRAGT